MHANSNNNLSLAYHSVKKGYMAFKRSCNIRRFFRSLSKKGHGPMPLPPPVYTLVSTVNVNDYYKSILLYKIVTLKYSYRLSKHSPFYQQCLFTSVQKKLPLPLKYNKSSTKIHQYCFTG